MPHWCGVVPTPALAAAAMARGIPAIMVTGSHIPEAHNGIKFYRPDGELLKQDEAPIRARAESMHLTGQVPSAVRLGDPDPSPERDYVARYVSSFDVGALSGLKLGVYEHSAAGRDPVAEILIRLGAGLVRFGRSERFVAVDTEALDPVTIAACADQIAQYRLDAVVSTDGDGDRPLLIGTDGQQVNGDVLCVLAARALKIGTVVTPLNSTSAVEQSGWFDKVIRTRVGSPYVVAAMRKAGGACLAGFEANGGFLLGSDLDLPGARLSALPTRDAMLPLVAVLAETRRRSIPLAALVAELPARVMKAERVREIPRQVSDRFLEDVAMSAPLRRRILPELEEPATVNVTDGARFGLKDGTIVHFRASGNAPELRLYVETGSTENTARLLQIIIARLTDILSD